MKAVVFHDVGDIRLDDVPEPIIEKPSDAIVRITTSAICGTDLHMVRGTMTDMKPGTILGHEGVGIVEKVGAQVRNFKAGDRVVIPSTIACGWCVYCRDGYFAQCDTANPHGKLAGTAFYGGPASSGPFNGLQAEFARVPFASTNLVRLPDDISDDQAILLSDVFPTGYFGADLADIKPGHTVAIFGCGPVGQFAILSARLLDAGRIIAVDRIESRLELAREQGAEIINFEEDDPVEIIRELTGGIGTDRVIDAVGVDADRPDRGPAAEHAQRQQEEYDRELAQVAPKTHAQGKSWQPGSAPGIVLQWAVQAVAKAGTLSVVGVYPETVEFFPFGQAMNKNLTIRSGNCNHRKYIPILIGLLASGACDVADFVTRTMPMSDIVEAYKAFDRHEPGWLKVEIVPPAGRQKRQAGRTRQPAGR